MAARAGRASGIMCPESFILHGRNQDGGLSETKTQASLSLHSVLFISIRHTRTTWIQKKETGTGWGEGKMHLAENLIKKLIFMATWQPNELLCKIIQLPHQGEYPSPSHRPLPLCQKGCLAQGWTIPPATWERGILDKREAFNHCNLCDSGIRIG